MLVGIDIGFINTAIVGVDKSVQNIIFVELVQMSTINQCYKNLTKLLDKLSEADIVLIEGQFSKNTRAKVIAGWIQMWLVCNKIQNKFIHAKNKYTLFENTCGDTKYKRKRWASEWFRQRFAHQQQLFSHIVKTDDISDAVLLSFYFAYGNKKDNKDNKDNKTKIDNKN